MAFFVDFPLHLRRVPTEEKIADYDDNTYYHQAEEEHDEPVFRHTIIGLLPHHFGSLLLLLQLIQPLAALLVNIARTEREEYDDIKEKAFHDQQGLMGEIERGMYPNILDERVEQHKDAERQ